MSNLENQALRLPKKERIALIRKLLQSLEPQDENYLDEWIEESHNRFKDYQEGKMETFSEEEAMRWVEKKKSK